MTADIEKTPTSNGTIPSKKKLDISDLVRGDGSWQRRVFLIVLFIHIPSATHNLAMSFLAPNLDHWCARLPGAENLSVEQWKSKELPPDDLQCSRYANINFTHPVQDTNLTREIVPCDSWEYDTTFYSSTVLSQWDLVCNRKWLVSMSKSLYVVGVLCAVTTFGYLSDRMGRRPTIAASSFIAVSSAIICAFSTSFIMFIVTRFFVAFGLAGCFNISFVLLMEVVGPELRSVYGMAVQFGWCLGFVSLPAIAWLLRDWFWIQVALTAPCLIMFAFWWMIPESPRWLLSQGKVEEAHKVLSRAAEVNGIKLSNIDATLKKVITKASEVQESGESKGNIFDLLRTPGLWQITLNLYFIWFANSFVYYGLSYNTNELAGDPFINFALSGAVEFPAYFLSIFAIHSLGRRNPFAGSMVIGGLACLLSYPLPQNPWWLTVTVSMIGKFFITCSYGIIYVFTAELFPTVVRNVGLGSASLCGMFGTILAPFIRELGIASHPVVPQIVFGVLAVVGGTAVLLLPETKNCCLSDTLKEAAESSRSHYPITGSTGEHYGRRTKKPNMPNGNYVTITISNGDAEVPQKDMTSQIIFAPSPKLEANDKKLADVPEDDTHCEDIEKTEYKSTTNEDKSAVDTLEPVPQFSNIPSANSEPAAEPSDVLPTITSRTARDDKTETVEDQPCQVSMAIESKSRTSGTTTSANESEQNSKL